MKNKIFTKWILIIGISLLIVGIDHACIRHSKAEEWTPSDGGSWQPPSWIDNLVTPEPDATVAPTEQPDPTTGPILMLPSRSYFYFNQANFSYIPGTPSDQLYLHTSNDGTNSYISFPPYTLDPVQRLNSSALNSGRYLPYSGKTNSSNPFDSRYGGYLLCLAEEARIGSWEFGDSLTYDLQFPTIKLFQQQGLSDAQFLLFQYLGYDSPALITADIYCYWTITDIESGGYRNLQTDTFSYTYDQLMQGISLTSDVPRFIEGEETISYFRMLIIINPYGSIYYGDTLTPLREAYVEDTSNLYDHTKFPHYNFANDIGSDYGVYIVRHAAESETAQSISLLSRAIQFLFVPTEQQITDLFDSYLPSETDMSDSASLALRLRQRIYDLFVNHNVQTNLVIDFPGCEIPIGGQTYTLWEPYHFDLFGLWLSSGSDPADLQDIFNMVHFATDTLITCAFVNSLIGLVAAAWDLHLWKGTEGEDVT